MFFTDTNTNTNTNTSNEAEKASDMLSTWFSLRQIQLGNDKDNDAEN